MTGARRWFRATRRVGAERMPGDDRADRGRAARPQRARPHPRSVGHVVGQVAEHVPHRVQRLAPREPGRQRRPQQQRPGRGAPGPAPPPAGRWTRCGTCSATWPTTWPTERGCGPVRSGRAPPRRSARLSPGTRCAPARRPALRAGCRPTVMLPGPMGSESSEGRNASRRCTASAPERPAPRS